ncbi:MAG: hypothetical protein KC492_35725 [Myxococcales bacterium]|nr:hypothetical protein [Myxococcales bacterium]
MGDIAQLWGWEADQRLSADASVQEAIRDAESLSEAREAIREAGFTISSKRLRRLWAEAHQSSTTLWGER